MRNLIDNKTGRISILIILVLSLVSVNIMAQTENNTIKEAKGLQIGDVVRNFSAIDMNKDKFVLNNALKKGPIVVIFYRGQWCPVCNRHLSNIQDSLKLIYNKGATVIAISPERPEHLKETAEKTQASFLLLYDEDYKISEEFDVITRPKYFKRLSYNFIGAKLKKAHSDDSQRLPIPATFVIDQNGKIVWRQFNPDYHERSTAKEIIDALDKLK